MGPNTVTGVFARERRGRFRHERQREDRQKLEGCNYKPRNVEDFARNQKLEDIKEGFFLRAFRGRTALLTT